MTFLSRARRAGALAVASGIVLAAVATPMAANAALTVSGGGGSYVEQDPPVRVTEDLVIAGGSSYAGKYIDFAITDATASERLSMITTAEPVVTSGAVSIVGSSVYLGNGSTADPIGSVDSARNGQNGQPLRINFTSEFVNPSFEEGTATGWTSIESRVDLGVTSIAGFVPTDTSTYPTNVPNQDDNIPQRAGTNTVSVQSSVRSDGTYAMQLTSSSVTTAQGCDVVHGPAVFSAPFPAAAGDKIYFDWRAYQGADNYHVFGYIVDENGAQTEVLDATGGGNTEWTTKETTIPTAGQYRFVFVAGTHDATCGLAAGASLYIDNVRVFGTKATNTVAQDVARLVQYENSSDNPATERTVTVTAVSNDAGTGTGTFPIAITPVDDALTVQSMTDLSYVNAYGTQDFTNQTGTFAVVDPDDTSFSFVVDGAVNDATTIDSVTATHRVDATYGALYYSSTTGQYVFVPTDAVIDPRQSDDSRTFTVTATANGLSDSGPLNLSILVPASAPGEPTHVEAEGRTGEVRLSWVPNVWTGGSVTSSYTVDMATDGSPWTEVATTPDGRTWMDIEGLTGGVTYDFRVRATNSTGTSDDSATASAMPVSVPTAPRDVAATHGDRSAIVTWVAPESAGGSPITGYRVDVSTDGGATWSTGRATAGPYATSVAVTGLTNGSPVLTRVVAINAVGASDATRSDAVTPRTTPSAPASGSSAHGDGQVALMWQAPVSDGGSPITGYRVERLVDDTWVSSAEVGSDIREVVMDGLANGQAVTYRVRALNSEGAGDAHEFSSVIPRTVPGAPTIGTIDGDARRLLLTIQAPSDNGGAAVSGYDVSTDGGATWRSAVLDGSRWAIWGLENGEEYSVIARAVNSEGFGAESNSLTGTPMRSPLMDDAGLLPVVPDVKPGASSFTVNGQPETAKKSSTATGVEYTSGGLSVSLACVSEEGTEYALDSRGNLIVTPEGLVSVAGSGFAPGSSVDVWLFSEPVLLGEVAVDADGEFRSMLPLPEGVAAGEHTLQLNGTSAEGETVSLSLGITILADAGPALAQTGANADSVGAAAIAAVLLLLGGAAVRARRPRVARLPRD